MLDDQKPQIDDAKLEVAELDDDALDAVTGGSLVNAPVLYAGDRSLAL